MGLSFFKVSSSSYDRIGTTPTCTVIERKKEIVQKQVNPDPANFRITNFETVNRFLIVQIYYIGVTSFEGFKVLVYKNTKIEDLLKQGTIDPHFSNSRMFKSPIARFAASRQGLQMARHFAKHWKWN
jgi:hypothetical protein